MLEKRRTKWKKKSVVFLSSGRNSADQRHVFVDGLTYVLEAENNNVSVGYNYILRRNIEDGGTLQF